MRAETSSGCERCLTLQLPCLPRAQGRQRQDTCCDAAIHMISTVPGAKYPICRFQQSPIVSTRLGAMGVGEPNRVATEAPASQRASARPARRSGLGFTGQPAARRMRALASAAPAQPSRGASDPGVSNISCVLARQHPGGWRQARRGLSDSVARTNRLVPGGSWLVAHGPAQEQFFHDAPGASEVTEWAWAECC